MSNRYWTKQEEEQLAILYPIYGIQYCANKLNRSLMAVQKKAGRLNLPAAHIKGRKGSPKSHYEYEQQLLSNEIDAFPLEQYKGAKTAILHECLDGHQWKISPDNLLRGRYCPSCSVSGFKVNLPAILYYIKIGKYFKIGITNNSVQERFARDKEKPLTILSTRYFSIGQKALEKEQYILRLYASYRIHDKNYLKSSGNTELFIEDILDGDYNLERF